MPRLQNWPKSDPQGLSYFADPKSAMYQGLANNFALEYDADNGLGILSQKYDFSKLTDNMKNLHTWAYPEYSYLLRSKRITFNNIKDNFNKAIRQTTLGGGGSI